MWQSNKKKSFLTLFKKKTFAFHEKKKKEETYACLSINFLTYIYILCHTWVKTNTFFVCA